MNGGGVLIEIARWDLRGCRWSFAWAVACCGGLLHARWSFAVALCMSFAMVFCITKTGDETAAKRPPHRHPAVKRSPPNKTDRPASLPMTVLLPCRSIANQWLAVQRKRTLKAYLKNRNSTLGSGNRIYGWQQPEPDRGSPAWPGGRRSQSTMPCGCIPAALYQSAVKYSTCEHLKLTHALGLAECDIYRVADCDVCSAAQGQAEDDWSRQRAARTARGHKAAAGRIHPDHRFRTCTGE